ncbi:MAG: hypothetical protein GY714_03655 [Desulfobacterales bacterium]|nr:hypothetical protein [Desulfobacterales bacterium]MCP4159905.1 hypothetical protein [Deltaproteobacteria bacterium]
MLKLKRLIVYALGLIAGTFCGTWASKIAIDSFGIQGTTFISNKIMIPTNVSGAIEFLVIIVVFLATVELVERLGILK